MTLGSASETCTAKVDIKSLSFSSIHDLTALNGSTINILGGSVSAEIVQLGGSQSRPAALNVSKGKLTIDNGIRTLFAGSKGKAIVNITETGEIEAANIIVGSANPNVQPGSELNATGSSTSTGAVNIIVHKGATITAASGAQVGAIKKVTINGTVNVQGGVMPIGEFSGTVQSGAVTVGPNGELDGEGTIIGDLYGKFSGTVIGRRNPKVGAGNTPGILTVNGNVDLDAGTILEMEIGGTTPGTQHDQIVATGSINVAGLASVAIINSGNGFQLPSVGNQFTLLSAAGGVTANFANGSSLFSVAGGSRVDWAINSTTNTSVLQAMNITLLPDGDYTGDGAVDAADYVVWRKSVGGINLAADGNRDGVVNDVDLAVWRTHFGQVGGAFGELSTVPEPGVMAFLAILAATVFSKRRRSN
jgi:hypothetical protein